MNNLDQYQNIGITGIIGSGKTYTAQLLNIKYNFNIIEIDDVRRELLWSSNSDLAINLRKQVIQSFNIIQHNELFFFNRKSFTDLIFSDQQLLNLFNIVSQPFIKYSVQQLLPLNKKNCIVWTNLIEENYIDLVEHVILLDISENVWKTRNLKDIDFLQARLKKQLTFNDKLNLIKTNNISYSVCQND